MRPSGRRFMIVLLALAGGTLILSVAWYFRSTEPIEIVRAEYGVPGRTCSALPEIMKHVSDACGGFRPRCLVSVSTGWCGDPAPGVVKTLTVEFRCGAKPMRASAADGTGLVLACP